MNKELENTKYNNLTLVKFSHRTRLNNIIWDCKCDCGNSKKIRLSLILSNIVKSCGCESHPNGQKSKSWKGCGEISSSYWVRRVDGARRREIKFDIAIEQAWELFLSQNKKCVFTGIELTFNMTSKKDYSYLQTASLDRIDSSKDYTIDNVQWVHKDINMMKRSLTDKKFIFLCNKIVNYRRLLGEDQYSDLPKN